MRRMPALLCVLTFAIAFAACSSDASTTAPTGTTATTASPPSPTAEPTEGTTGTTTAAPGSPVPPPQPDVRLPHGMSGVVDDPTDMVAISAGDLTPLVPSGSSPATSAVLARPDAPIDQIAVTWEGGEPPLGPSGMIVWQLVDADRSWRAVYAFTDPRNSGVFGVRIEQADVTGDEFADLLSFEDVGGSGACGTYRVVASTNGDASEILRRDVCDTQIQIAGGDLLLRAAVFEPDDPHCCPSAFRTTVLRWNGSAWERVSSEISPVPRSG
jgi:hypothetical protein